MNWIAERFHATIQAHNDHRVVSVLSLVSDDIRFELVGQWVKVGKAAVRELEEWHEVLNNTLVARDIEVRGDELGCQVTECNDWFMSRDFYAGGVSAALALPRLVALNRPTNRRAFEGGAVK